MDKEKVLELASLSRIELNFDDFDTFNKKLNDIESYINMLDELDLEGVEPTIWSEMSPARLREDSPKMSLEKEEVFKNASDHKYGYFEMKKVVE
ncbi:MAG: Asp-tRNA(Asn)/Glu-tRNA(Gln) amidotransferase subunit GatC [Tissierellia bacterium]|nr:Asp-tRNA(Asn)/Glu-tRNA(Gln) amidotransferase subunit GatC [Tissierellia bacterium]